MSFKFQTSGGVKVRRTPDDMYHGAYHEASCVPLNEFVPLPQTTMKEINKIVYGEIIRRACILVQEQGLEGETVVRAIVDYTITIDNAEVNINIEVQTMELNHA